MAHTWRNLFGWTAVGTFVHLVSASPIFAAPTFQPPVEIPATNQILSTLKKSHPRLLAFAEDFARLRERVKSDTLLKKWHGDLQGQARKILSEPPSKYEIPDGLRLLSTSRRVLHRIQTLGLLHQLDGDQRYAERAWKELEAAAAFKDWNPRHFLDTAEMTHAFAIGYDWLYATWTDQQRATLREAMVEKGLKLALQIVEEDRGWARAHHNWNQVCNGGIGMGALALADVEPDLAARFLSRSLKSIQRAMVEFAPDGAWAEGPGYWNYATTYNAVILAALHTALGTDFGLSKIAGFPEAGMFPIYATGPLRRTFNYADAGDGAPRAPHMFWFARQFDRPAYAAYQRQMADPDPLDMVWYDPQGGIAALKDLALDKYFRNSEVALFRSAWDDRNAVFAGFKAGDNKANHSNLDLGSFVLDALGARWAVDLGADDYNLPGYFGKQRWTYYRLRAEGHNTLVIDPGAEPDQDPAGASRIVKFESKPEKAFAVADLTAPYKKHAQKVWRGFAFLDRHRVLVQDEVQAEKPAEVWWFLHTPAKVEPAADGRSAILSQNGARLEARILSPPQATFTVMDAAPLKVSPQPDKQNANRGVRKLAVELKEVTKLKLAVLLTPQSAGETRIPSVEASLKDW